MKNNLDLWAHENFVGLVILNICLMILVLLHSAGYFEPYLPVTINIVILLGVIIMRLVLRVTSQVVFVLALFFMVFAMFLKLLNLDIWAQRSMIYCFETILIGCIALLVETMASSRNVKVG